MTAKLNRKNLKKNHTAKYVDSNGKNRILKVSTACNLFGKCNVDPKTGDVLLEDGMSKCKDCSWDIQKACIVKLNPKMETEKKNGGPKNRVGKMAELKVYMLGLVKEAKHTRKDIVDLSMIKFPDYAKITIGTIITDSFNAKYFAKSGLGVKCYKDGKIAKIE